MSATGSPSFAHALLTLLGAAGEACGLERTLKANTVKTSHDVPLQPGSRWYRAIPNMRDERLVPLMQGFRRLVADLAAFRKRFGLL